MIEFWTDGSANPNPGPGGFAVLDSEGNPVALGGSKKTTNIRMEGMALLMAMRRSEASIINTDSDFWIKTLTQYAPEWEKNNWTKKGGEIKNIDLVKLVYNEYKNRNIKLNFVYGHKGTELNELADSWAKRAREGERL